MDKNNKTHESKTLNADATKGKTTSSSTSKSDAAQNKSCHTGKCSSPRKNSDKSPHTQDEGTGTC